MKSILHVEYFYYDRIVVTLVWKSSIDSLIFLPFVRQELSALNCQPKTASLELSVRNISWELSVQILRDKPVRYQTVPGIRSRIVSPQLVTVSQDSHQSDCQSAILDTRSYLNLSAEYPQHVIKATDRRYRKLPEN